MKFTRRTGLNLALAACAALLASSPAIAGPKAAKSGGAKQSELLQSFAKAEKKAGGAASMKKGRGSGKYAKRYSGRGNGYGHRKGRGKGHGKGRGYGHDKYDDPVSP